MSSKYKKYNFCYKNNKLNNIHNTPVLFLQILFNNFSSSTSQLWSYQNFAKKFCKSIIKIIAFFIYIYLILKYYFFDKIETEFVLGYNINKDTTSKFSYNWYRMNFAPFRCFFIDKMLLQKFGKVSQISTNLILAEILQVIRNNIRT